MSENELSEAEQAELAAFLQSSGGGAPMPEEKHNAHKFIHDVSTSEDTTKTGYLTKDELGVPKHPVRVYKELANFCKEVANMDYMADYLNKKAEIITSTSLSRDAKLVELAVVQRREVADVTKKSGKENKGWFGKKKKGDSTES